MKVIVAFYDDLEDAREAVEELVDVGLLREDISFVVRDVGGGYTIDLEECEAVKGASEAAAGVAAPGAIIRGLIGVVVEICLARDSVDVEPRAGCWREERGCAGSEEERAPDVAKANNGYRTGEAESDSAWHAESSVTSLPTVPPRRAAVRVFP